MKRKIFLGALPAGMLILVLAACGTAAPSGSATAGNERGNQPLPKQSELALGTLKLEGTAQAVDSETAAALLPMWKLLQEMNSSSTAAPQEIDAVVEAIETALTPERADAISAMHLTQVDLFAYMQENKIMPTPSANSRRGNGFTGGPGGPPGGGEIIINGRGGGEGPISGPGGPGSFNPTMMATFQARAGKSLSSGVPDSLFSELLRLLERKSANVTPTAIGS
jgi:hypothetical protein